MNVQSAVPVPTSRLQRWLRHVVIVSSMLGFVAMLAGIGSLLITGIHPARRDVISYWAAGQRIASHADPYDADAVLRLERAAGFSQNAPVLIMRNPPYALPLTLPLSFFGLKGASLLWSVFLLASLALSVYLFWVARGRPANRLYLLGYAFAPALACVMTGQTALFALLGLVLFLRFHRRREFAAGMSLWLCALKPHLFLPFSAVLLLWIVATRRYRIIAGALLVLAASSALAASFDPFVWAHFIRMLRSPGVQTEFVPCISYALRALYPRAAWLQYVPAAAGCCWAVWFYLRRIETWDWMEDGALLMLVSLLVSPYAWLTDNAILVPALLVGLSHAATRTQLAMLALPNLLIEVAQFSGVSMHSAIFMAVPPYWLAWYLYAARKSQLHGNAGMSTADFAKEPAFHSL